MGDGGQDLVVAVRRPPLACRAPLACGRPPRDRLSRVAVLAGSSRVRPPSLAVENGAVGIGAVENFSLGGGVGIGIGI